MTRFVPGALLVTLLFAASESHAEEPERDSAPQARAASPRSQEFHVVGGPGWARDQVLGDVVTQSLALGFRYGWFEPAIVANAGTPIFGGGYASVAMSVGAVIETDDANRFTLRGALGSDSYSGVGCGLFCQSGGASATLPYAGVHVAASHVFGASGRTHLELGLEGFYGRDLARERVDYTTTGGLFGTSTSEDSRTLGGQRVGALLTVGLTYDVAERRSASSNSAVARR